MLGRLKTEVNRNEQKLVQLYRHRLVVSMNRPYVPSEVELDGTSSGRSSSPFPCLRFLFPSWRFPRGMAAAGEDATRTDIGATFRVLASSYHGVSGVPSRR